MILLDKSVGTDVLKNQGIWCKAFTKYIYALKSYQKVVS